MEYYVYLILRINTYLDLDFNFAQIMWIHADDILILILLV